MERNRESGPSPKALVIGGGLGGIRAALDLAESGRSVVLIESAPHVGGLLTQLDRTFSNDNCDLCSIFPRFSASRVLQNIKILTMTEVTAVRGEAGNFTVSLTTSPRYIDLKKCTACGECVRKLPECVRFFPGLNFLSPTCIRYPQASPQAFSIEMGQCPNLDRLIQSCPANAILPDDKETMREEVFGSIILAQGADVFDPSGIHTLGYGQHPDVLTSLEYERMLSAFGPTKGQFVRPSNGRKPSKIAWILCVGSRGSRENHVPYCSSICCMFALKEILVTKERFGEDIEACVFYMDMRTSGKDHEFYYQQAKEELGVRFIRCRTRNVIHNDKTNHLSITYLPDSGNTLVTENFDMVVLATGFRIQEKAGQLAHILGIDFDKHGFIKTGGFNPSATSRPGITVCGLCEAPKDIAETITQAGAAACLAAVHVAPSSPGRNKRKEVLPERDVSNEEPKVGVFICRGASAADEALDIRNLAADISALPQVEIVDVIDETCSYETMRRIENILEEGRINRLVIAGSSPRILKTQWSDLLHRSGLNKRLLEIANIREQNTWPHQDHPKEIAEKAGDLIRMAVAAVKAVRPVPGKPLPINKNVLVIGGGVAGMTAALNMAEQHFKVYLAERSDELGGAARNIHRTLEGEDIGAMVEELVKKTEEHESIHIIKNAAIIDHVGKPGIYKTEIQGSLQKSNRWIEHGVTIMATGALSNRPPQYLLGEHAAVLTQLDADRLIVDQPDKVKDWNKIVMIQCVGSRSPENPNCSRICCQAAIKNSLRILDLNPKARIFVLYRDMRTSGLQEERYREARGRGVIFIPYDKDVPPRVETAGAQIRVTFHDPVLSRQIALNADSLLLSTGFVVDEAASSQLANTFGLPRTRDGFFLEDHTKLMPVTLSKPGFFVAGTAHGPKTIRESVAQGQAAAARAMAFLANEELISNIDFACVDDKKCAACLMCVRVCPYNVPYINGGGYSQIDEASCRGCGVCAAECPSKAIRLIGAEDERILAKLEGLFDKGASYNG